MPALDASSTAVFSAIGINPSTVYAVFVSLVGTAVSFGLWLIQVGWPFILGAGFLYLMYRLATRFIGFGR